MNFAHNKMIHNYDRNLLTNMYGRVCASVWVCVSNIEWKKANIR